MGKTPENTEWSSVRVGEVAESISQTHAMDKKRLVFLNTSDVLEGRILHGEYSTVNNWPGQAKKAIRRNDILFSEIRPTNRRYAFVDIDVDDYVVSTKLMVIRTKDPKLARYLYYFLTTEDTIRWLQHIAESRSGTFPQITFDQISELELNLPPTQEIRDSIVAAIDAFRNKIEHNRKTNYALERLARAIYASWLVNFEPVQAKAAGATDFPLMPQETFDALPKVLVESEIGPIPEGWAVKSLTDVIQVNPTRSLRRGKVAPYLDMKNMPTEGHAPVEWTSREVGSGMRFANGDTLVARITPCLENGKTAYVDFLDENEIGWGSTEYLVLRPKQPLPDVFAYCLARSNEFRDFAIQNMTGTSGRQRVAAAALEHYRLVIPPPYLAEAFGQYVGPLFAWMRTSIEQCRTLNTLRDVLVPRLLTGDVRIEVNHG